MAVGSISEFLSIIDGVALRYSRQKTKADLIFRGASDFNHHLLPGIYRKNAKGESMYEAQEGEILHHFIKNAMSKVNNVASDDLLTWLTYAQHFGAPTRLLDFSSNPLISLYFCCKRMPDRDGAVCVLNESRYASSLNLDSVPGRRKQQVLAEIVEHVQDAAVSCTKYPVTLIPYFIDTRMEAQDSHFLVWGSDTSSFENIAAPYGSMLENAPEAFFGKIRISGAHKEQLLRELSFLGINEKKLFPGLDGIGAYITQFYCTSRDELII